MTESRQTDVHEIPSLIVSLSEGGSDQTRWATKLWYALATVSALSLMPVATASNTLQAPFGIGELNSVDFYSFAVVAISILGIGAGAAQCQAIRSRSLINRVLDEYGKEYPLTRNVALQDAFDAVVTSSIQRIAPLAQVLRGRCQFYPESHNCPLYLRLLSSLYYTVLKLVSVMVVHVFPAYALVQSALRSRVLCSSCYIWGIPNFVIWPVLTVALIVAVQMVCMDALYFLRAMRNICPRRVPVASD